MYVQDAQLTHLAIATTAIRDLYLGYGFEDIVGLDGSSGLRNLLIDLVTQLRGAGVDDERVWNTPHTASIPVAKEKQANGEIIGLLCLATTAIRDLERDFPHNEIDAGTHGKGVGRLIRCLVSELRGRDVDDEGGWDCDVTRDIAVVAATRAP